jgi:ubiquinone/menaquinone biosynthesis C-methylase UbiE
MCPVSLASDTPALAQHYERVSVDRQFKVGQQLVERLRLAPGERVLDVGCGTGLLAAYAARSVGPSGSVLGIDPLPLRIRIAQSKAQPNLAFRVGDAYELGAFESDSFDVVYLNAVLHWLPQKLRPLVNFHRLLKPGGRLGINTASKDHPNRIQQVLSREPYRRYPEAGIPHRVNAEQLRSLLETSGFEIESLHVEPSIHHHESVDAALEHMHASAFGNFLTHLPSDLRELAHQELIAELEQLRTPDGIRHEGGRLLAVAIKR